VKLQTEREIQNRNKPLPRTKMKVERTTGFEMSDADVATETGFDSSDDDSGEVDLSPLEISW
jgi:hypothetical protein